MTQKTLDLTGEVEFALRQPLFYNADRGNDSLFMLIQRIGDNFNDIYAHLAGLYNVAEYGAEGDNTADDSAAVQAAIDAASAAGGGIVVAGGAKTYRCETGLVVKENVTLVNTPGSVFRFTEDVNGVQLQGPGSRLDYADVWMDYTPRTKAALLVADTSAISGSGRVKMPIGASNVRLRGQRNVWEGYGLHLLADGDGVSSVSVQWTFFDNITIHDFEDGVRLECKEDSGETAFCNGNSIDGVSMEDCINFFHLVTSGTGSPAISGNNISNTQAQTGSQTVRHTLIDGVGGVTRNFLTGMMVWDYTAANGGTGGLALEVEAGNTRNHFQYAGISDEAGNISVDIGDDFNILFAELHERKLAERTISSVESKTPADHKGWMYLIDDGSSGTGVAFCNGTAWGVLGGGHTIDVETPDGEDYTFDLLELIEGRFYKTPTAAAGSTPVTFDISAGVMGSVVHIQRRGASEVIEIDPGAKRFYDNFAGTTSNTSEKLSLDTQYAEVILRCVEGQHWTILYKRGTISFVA